MNNLLSANFTRLKKDKMFWIFTGFVVAHALLSVIVANVNIDTFLEYGNTFDDIYFGVAPTVGFFIPVFTSFFIGAEYSDGTLRNKIIVGNFRTNIYLSNLVTIIMLFLMYMFIWATICLIAIPVVGGFVIGIPNAINYIIIMMFVIATFAAIFTFIAMLCPNKARTLLISMITLLVLHILFSSIDSVLKYPEMITGWKEVNGVIERAGTYPNPKYLDNETLRTIFEYILDFLPTNQSIKVAWLEVQNPFRMIVFSLVNTITITICGVLLFNKKDLK